MSVRAILFAVIVGLYAAGLLESLERSIRTAPEWVAECQSNAVPDDRMVARTARERP